MTIRKWILSALLIAGMVTAARAQESLPAVASERSSWPEAIEDNSFLIEEAYNQEPGVVQYIFNYVRTRPDGAWALSFTNEWPVPDERNQLSFSVYEVCPGSGEPSGFGDLYLNYRYQALFEEKDGVAFAPRLTAIAPTGRWRKGEGDGTWGWQASLPFSKRVASSLAIHLNLGATYFPSAKSLEDSGREARNDLLIWNEGASFVWLLHPRFNLFVEFVATQAQQPDGRGGLQRSSQALANPGFRWAFNFPKGQLVLGASAPMGLTHDSPRNGVFLYLSWEAPAWKPKAAA